MKNLVILAAAAALGVVGGHAQGSGTATGDQQPAAGPGGDERARYVALGRREFELSTRFKLLSELGQDFQARAEKSRTNGQTDQARWEGDRSREFLDRAARELTEMNAVLKQKAAIEDARRIVVPDPFDGGGLATNTLTADEAAYLSKIQETAWELERDLNTILEQGRLYTLQLLTNNTPDEVGRVSLQLEDNAFQLRMLQRAMNDLELSKLQFKALRRPR